VGDVVEIAVVDDGRVVDVGARDVVVPGRVVRDTAGCVVVDAGATVVRGTSVVDVSTGASVVVVVVATSSELTGLDRTTSTGSGRTTK
jgi:hypothetical protein